MPSGVFAGWRVVMGRGGIAAAWWSSSGRKVPAVELRGRASELLTNASMKTSERVNALSVRLEEGFCEGKGVGRVSARSRHSRGVLQAH